MITISFAKYHWDTNDPIKNTFRICYSNDLKVMPPHFHDEIELMYFFNTSGCYYLCGGENLILDSGDMVIVNSREIHACSIWGKECSAICIIINRRQLHTNCLSNLHFNNKIESDRKISHIMDSVKELLLSNFDEAETDCRINALIYALLAEIIKYSSANERKSKTNCDFSEIFSYIEQNLAEKLTISDLAGMVHLSVDRFYHIFKEQTGVSPTNYIISRRIERVCKYLESTDMSISEIAQECNFCTSSYLSKKFKEYMKLSPKEYKKSSSIQINTK